MSQERIQSMCDIIDNLAAVRGNKFAQAVSLAVHVSSLIGMIATAEMNEAHRCGMIETAATTCSMALAVIADQNNFDPKEITDWADRVIAQAA